MQKDLGLQHQMLKLIILSGLLVLAQLPHALLASSLQLIMTSLGWDEITATNESTVCNPRLVDPKDPHKIICVCSRGSCNDLSGIGWPEDEGQVFIYMSSAAGKRLALKESQLLDDGSDDSIGGVSSSIYVNLNNKHQTIMGWGGAFTDAFCQNVKSLSSEMQHKLLASYYGPTGLHYNFGRVPIGGTDFSSRNYTYDDAPASSDEPDYELKNWSLAKEDHKYKIPVIKDALELAKSMGVQVKLFASPWSAPAWMKSNMSLVRGHLIDTDQVYKSYTEYLMNFYRAYKREGINFWGATVQNEPIASYLPVYFFNSMQFSVPELTKFIGQYLGPTLWKEGYTKDKFKLIVGDDSLGFLNYQIPRLMADSEVRKYVSGLAFHWYVSGWVVPYSEITKAYEPHKDTFEFLIMSEACEGSMPFQESVELGSWQRAESYAKDIIEDLNRETNAWIDWNMALDLKGGPNWSGNYADSPILVNGTADEFYKQPMYYALAHFSRFLKPGLATMVESKLKKHSWFSPTPLVTSFYDAQNRYTILVILNKHPNKMNLNINIKLEHGDKVVRIKELELDERSISTVILRI